MMQSDSSQTAKTFWSVVMFYSLLVMTTSVQC